MTAPKRPAVATTIVAVLPHGDRRPTLVRPHHDRGGMFSGWGPKI